MIKLLKVVTKLGLPALIYFKQKSSIDLPPSLALKSRGTKTVCYNSNLTLII
jgi:hypothetical protein